MNALFLLQHRLDLYHMLVPQLPQYVHPLQQPRTVWGVEVVDLADQHSGVLVCAFLALPEGVVLLHYHDHLLRHFI